MKQEHLCTMVCLIDCYLCSFFILTLIQRKTFTHSNSFSLEGIRSFTFESFSGAKALGCVQLFGSLLTVGHPAALPMDLVAIPFCRGASQLQADPVPSEPLGGPSLTWCSAGFFTAGAIGKLCVMKPP